MKNKYGEELEVCVSCIIKHYVNCTTCLGFGIMKYPKHEESVPISAGEAIDKKRLPEWKPCPECMSTPGGLVEIRTTAKEDDVQKK